MINKKALSAIISVTLIIGLTMAAGAIILVVVKNFSEGRLDGAKSCLDILEKIEINNDYTCYNVSENQIQFSLSRKEIGLTYLSISISSELESKNFKLYDQEMAIEDVSNYPSGTGNVSLPGNESGKTYLVNWTSEAPALIQIAPSIGRKNCEVVDEISSIPNCT